ncbi:hypothetical protein PYCCODRAFT_1481950 [Trametes coccinea BRFM310]|uniref:BAG domain-containing protein n=1 Tax=Trametes coccinea (strain BRFM310) TaxID=1353009 RepID=A0A1Y2I5K3_TRAC3|nr:hypothetical protein PYCCODRAFT_1481950 [Trametes coccinea BRFM310]
MLVLTPVPAHTTSYAPRVPASIFYSEVDYYDAVAQQAAQDYAAARARVRAIEQRREQIRQLQAREEAARRQAALDDYYLQQSQFIAASIRPYAPARRPSSCAIEELSYSVRREEERRRVLLARQREAQRVRALAEAQKREEAERRHRARLEAQQEREDEAAILAFLGLGPVAREKAQAPQWPQPTVNRQTHFAATSQKPVDAKGKGKAVDVPPVPVQSTFQPTSEGTSFKEELEARIRYETDPEVQESLVRLYSDIFDMPSSASSQPVAGPSTVKSQETSAPEATAPTTPKAEVSETDGAKLHRTPALPPAVAEKLLEFYHARRARKLSLTQIKDVEDALRKLQSTFEFPEHLDFVNPVSSEATDDSDEPGPLAYTPNNTPVHAYEHALNQLLIKLDGIESNGDLQVRGRRKEVVREVERALEAMERRVEESRERERERSRERRRSAASSPLESSPVSSDTEAEVTTPEKIVETETSVESTTPAAALATPATEAPETDTVSVALVDTPNPVDSVPASPVSSTPAPEVAEVAAPQPDTVSVAPVDVPPEASDSASVPVTPAQSSAPVVTSTPSSPSVAHSSVLDAPEPDTVSMSLVDLPAVTVPEISTAEDASSPADAPATETSMPSEDHEIVSPVAPSETSEATFVTAPSTVPSTVVPTPEAISRATSITTDATVITADVDFAAPSPVEPIPAPEAATRVPSEAPSTAEDTFLLSSTPLADEPAKKKQAVSVDDDMEVISKDEVAKSDSEWSDVESA